MDSKLLREALQGSTPLDKSKSPIENALELTKLPEIGPVSDPLYLCVDIPRLIRNLGYFHKYQVKNALPPCAPHKLCFRLKLTRTRECWRPPNTRGIFGGTVIAQSLAAAQATIPPPSPSNGNASFLIHSMHCYFVLAGVSESPILYHVERVREGRSFMTRTVQARQRGQCIFTTTCSFMRETKDRETLDHEWEIPEGAIDGLKEMLRKDDHEIQRGGVNRGSRRLIIVKSLPISNSMVSFLVLLLL